MDAAEPRPHKILVRVLLGVATVLAVLAIFSVWANRQALNADNWSHTSAQILANPAVKTQLSNYLVDQLFTNVDVAGELQTALPPRLQPLAGPAAGALRQLAGRTALVLLTRPRVEAAWERAN